MRCLFRLGCMAVLFVIAVAAWFTRDRWLPRVLGKPPTAIKAPPRETWDPVTGAGAARTRAALDRLSRQNGQVFEQLTGADVASYALAALTSDTSVVDSVQAGVFGNDIRVRGIVKTSALKGATGVVAAMLKPREPIELSGTMHVVRPGLGELTVTGVRLHNITVPDVAIPAVVQALSRGSRAGLGERGLAVPLPDYIGDIRIANGRVTLYKTVR